MNIHPMNLGEEKWQLLDNVDCQQITLAVKKFKDSKGDPAFRYRIIGLWTVDVLDLKLVLTKDPSDPKMFRKLLQGGETQDRRRPGGKRTATPILIKRKIDEGGGDFGYIWAREIMGGNSGTMPSVNLIRVGLGNEAKFLIKKAMGDAHDQYKVVQAENNAEEIWNNMLALVQVQDPDAPLEYA